MKDRFKMQIGFMTAVLSIVMLAQTASAQVTLHTDLTTFQAASNTTVESTFESFPPGFIASPFNDGSVTFDQPPGNVLGIVTPATSSQINPDALSNVLATNGNEDIDLTFTGPAPTAVGWDAYTNQFGPPLVTVFDTDGNLIARFIITQSPNTIGFVGITSLVPIGRVHWLAEQGGVEHTALDNVRVGRIRRHDLKFFLHGNDIPGTAGGYTMNLDPAPSETLSLNFANEPSWFSDPSLSGTFLPVSTFKLVMPCTLGINAATTYRLATTEPDGSSPQLLGETVQPLDLCLFGQKTVNFPVSTPVVITNRRLKLTIKGPAGINFNLHTGNGTFLQATSFVGTP
jgi:hypothetical protein